MSTRIFFIPALLAGLLGTPAFAEFTNPGVCQCQGGTAPARDVSGCKDPAVLKRICERAGLSAPKGDKRK